MFEEYKQLVISHYLEILQSDDPSINLKDPTPANLKKECLDIYLSRYNAESDSRILKDFFGKPDQNGSYANAIDTFTTANFRPVQQLMLKTDKDSSGRVVELLAWLTDYQPRPFRFDTFRKPTENPGPPKNPEPPKKPEPPKIPETTEQKKSILMTMQVWISQHHKESAFVLAVCGLAIVILIKLNLQKQCMYWADDHYEAVDCDKPIYGKQSIALDTVKLNHFKKITKPDTLTIYSIGKTWCTPVDTTLECFTADGRHPLYPSKELKPLSLYLLRKYFSAHVPESTSK